MSSPKKFLSFLLAITLIASACGSSTEDASAPADDSQAQEEAQADNDAQAETTEDDNEPNAAESADAQIDTNPIGAINGGKPAIEDIDFGGESPTDLVIEDFITGDGNAAEAGDLLVMHYVGVLHEDGSQFDASWDRDDTFSFVLGQGNVIQGWDDGIVGMTEGSRRQLTIPPQQAYGDNSPSPDIPNGSTLVFVVDLVAAYSPHDFDATDADVTTLDVTTVEEGDGVEVAAGDAIEVLYSIAPVSVGEVTQSSWTDRSTGIFVVGADPAEIFIGWSEGLVGQNVGDVVRIEIPPEFGPDPSQEDPLVTQVTILDVVG